MAPSDTEIDRLQTGIAALEAQRATIGDAVVEAMLAPLREKLAALQTLPQTAPQRKQITVLFADVSGFTALAETMDPEHVATFLNELWEGVDQAIRGHAGRVDKHIGDEVMAVWGAEVAREDDPEQAVRAALALQAAVQAFGAASGIPLALRVGVNTGLVLIGQVGSTGEFTPLGDAVNLASRLEQAAPAGGVLIAHDTYRHVRGIFDVQPQEPLAVKGKRRPVQTYLVERAKPRAFRLATRGVEGVETRMIGRDREFALLQEAFLEAIAAPETRAVTISREAGVGKSRLLYEFDNWLELQPQQIFYFKGRSSPRLQDVPYSLFRDLFAFRFQILDNDPLAIALDKFRAGMAGLLEPPQADIAGHWLGFDFSSSASVRPLLGSNDFATIARAHVTRFFRALAATGPVALLLEDIQWADDPSLDLVTHLTRAIPTAPFLVVSAARPLLYERRPGWGEGEPAFRRIILAPLSRRASRALVDEILQRVNEVPERLRELVAGAAEGNPFYVEELVKMLIEQEVIERDAPEPGHWHVWAERLEGITIPPTLTGLLQARLDSLPAPEREALQRASVVGRVFWDDCVAGLLPEERQAVYASLAAVRRRELIYRREQSAFAQTTEYLFKHTLLRDVAYETVLLKHRAGLHGQVARWLERHAGERHDELLELIAGHYIQAGEGLKAAALLEQAGQDALLVGTNAAAKGAFERALSLRAAAGDTTGPEARQAAVGLGEVYQWFGELALAEETLLAALAAAREAGDREIEARALVRLVSVILDSGNYGRARSLMAEAIPLVPVVSNPTRLDVLLGASVVGWATGDLQTAATWATEALAAARESAEIRSELHALNVLGIVANARDHPAEAQRWLRAGLDLARARGLFGRAQTFLLNLGNLAYRRGDYEEARALGLEALELCRELDSHNQMALVLCNLAQADLQLGDREAARRQAREALLLARRLGLTLRLLWAVEVYGEIAAAAGETARALALFGLVRAHPAVEHQTLLWIEDVLDKMNLPAAKIESGLAAGAALDLDVVVRELLEKIEGSSGD